MQPPSSQCDILFSSDLYSPAPPAPAEIFCLDSAGDRAPERLTYCSTGGTPCSLIEAAAAADSKRMAVRRVSADVNGDGRLDEGDGSALIFLNLEAHATAELVPQVDAVSGVDWSPASDLIVYSALAVGGRADLHAVDLSTQPAVFSAVTDTADVDERRPRYGRSASYLVYEHIDATGKGAVWIMNAATNQALTTGGEGTSALAGSGSVIGTDADPATAPADQAFVFRRLSACSLSLPGAWDVFTLTPGNAASPVPVTSGCAFRGAPDWGQEGLVFTEIDPGSGNSSLVLLDPTTGARRVLLTAPPGASIAHPRWLSASR